MGVKTFIGVYILAFALSAASSKINENPKYALTKLRKDILSGYDPHSRPAANNSHHITVSLGLTPIHLTKMDEERGIMVLEGWILMKWKDYNFQWDPNEYDGITELHLPIKDIWIPDIKLYQGLSDATDPTHDSLAIIYNTSDVIWVPPASLHTICNFTYDNYPRDTQTCSVTLGSWTYHSQHVDLIAVDEDTSESESIRYSNQEWDIIWIESSRNVKMYSCCKESYVSIEFKITLARRANRVESATRYPQIISAILILAMFWISSWRKLMLASTALIIETGLILYTAHKVPNIGAFPFAVYHLRVCMILSVAAFITELVLKVLSKSATRNPPARILSILRSKCLGVLLCLPNKESLSNDAESSSKKQDWNLFIVFCERLAFFLFLFCFIGITTVL